MKKILVIGSGPIIIGQAAEFDYAGTQACKSLREEGYSVVLINSNPATIMTDEETADAVYIEPLTPEFCERVIAKERPDGLLPTLGGQTGLNLASQLAQLGILEKYNVKLLGTQLEAIRKAEDRELFRSLMHEIKEPVPESWIVESESDLEGVLEKVPYPCIVRPAYTLGGTGGGIARNRQELWEIGRKGLKLSMRSQLMVERSLLGWKEVEYEVMRDKRGTCITVCNMENLDPMGVHTGDSIVVAPSQTLSDIEYHMLRTASLKIIDALGIEGGCNVQLAVNPDSFDYYIIEVNPRVSRSSALASKATGYPIARVAAKIAVGKTLDEIENAVTKTTRACFEPALDYCVVKIPRWPFDKFSSGDRSLFTQMKATGEVMAIDRTFEAALMKAIRGLEVKPKDLRHPKFMGHQARVDQSALVPEIRFEAPLTVTTLWLEDGLPEEVALPLLSERRQELDKAARRGEGENAAHRAAMNKIDRALDEGRGTCLLRDRGVAKTVAGILSDLHGLVAYCVMPNHIHVLASPLVTEVELRQALHAAGSGLVWAKDCLVLPVEDEDTFRHALDSVESNPVRAGLFDWPWQTRNSPVYQRALMEGRMADEDLRQHLRYPTDERLWALAEGLRRGWDHETVYDLCKVDHWFLQKLTNLLGVEQRLIRAKNTAGRSEPLLDLVREAFLIGFPSPSIYELLGLTSEVRRTVLQLDSQLGDILTQAQEPEPVVLPGIGIVPMAGKSESPTALSTMIRLREVAGGLDPAYLVEAARAVEKVKVQPVFKMVDTCAGEFESATPYYYSTFEQEDDFIAAPTSR